MSEFGDELVRSAGEALAIARGTREPAFVRVPGTADGATGEGDLPEPTEEQPGRMEPRRRPTTR